MKFSFLKMNILKNQGQAVKNKRTPSLFPLSLQEKVWPMEAVDLAQGDGEVS